MARQLRRAIDDSMQAQKEAHTMNEQTEFATDINETIEQIVLSHRPKIFGVTHRFDVLSPDVVAVTVRVAVEGLIFEGTSLADTTIMSTIYGAIDNATRDAAERLTTTLGIIKEIVDARPAPAPRTQDTGPDPSEAPRGTQRVTGASEPVQSRYNEQTRQAQATIAQSPVADRPAPAPRIQHDPNGPPTPKQYDYLEKLVSDRSYQRVELGTFAKECYGIRGTDNITKRDAGQMIEDLLANKWDGYLTGSVPAPSF